jgi:hypothetical protein
MGKRAPAVGAIWMVKAVAGADSPRLAELSGDTGWAARLNDFPVSVHD